MSCWWGRKRKRKRARLSLFCALLTRRGKKKLTLFFPLSQPNLFLQQRQLLWIRKRHDNGRRPLGQHPRRPDRRLCDCRLEDEGIDFFLSFGQKKERKKKKKRKTHLFLLSLSKLLLNNNTKPPITSCSASTPCACPSPSSSSPRRRNRSCGPRAVLSTPTGSAQTSSPLE